MLFIMKKIIIHHSGNHNTKELIYFLHVDKYKWENIGYHFLITKKGKIEKLKPKGFFSFAKSTKIICDKCSAQFSEEGEYQEEIPE